jgi:NAD(P)-dependent dehydrogenase (short-subunit alcohol dehydrogenase family)
MKKVIIITGCSTGIGRELAFRMNSLGWTVAATARHIAMLEPLREAGCLTFTLDVTITDQIDRVIREILEQTGRIDMLVNNAGYGLIMPLMDIPADELERQFRTNVTGTLELIRKVAPVMKKQGSGTIVNMGSISGIAPTPFAGSYCASKAAIHAWSDVLRMELKPFGITVVTLQPGGIATDFGKNSSENVARLMNPGSWYNTIREFIFTRANTSQESATPVDVFVDRLVRKINIPHPPAIIRIGKRSLILPFLKRWIPVRMLDSMMMKKYGLDRLRN